MSSTGAPIPADEDERLARLRELVVLDSDPEPVFENIARTAAQICGTPIALISLIDAERQWFKANVGLPGVYETERDVAFCAHAIVADETLQVADATLDTRFQDNPLVTGEPHIRFYAGAPLSLPRSGTRVGTLCVIDRVARTLSPEQLAMLRSLAGIATEALAMRRDLISRALQVRTSYERTLAESEARHRALVEDQAELISLADETGRLLYVNPSYAQHFALTPPQMIGANLFDFVDAADRDAVRRKIMEVFATGKTRTSENRMVTPSGQARWVAWTNTLQRDARGTAILHSVGRDITEQRRAEEALGASQAFLARTGRVAGVGGWQLDLASGQIDWSEQTRTIHEVGPDYVPALESAIEFYAPSARPEIHAAVERGVADGTPWDLELPLVTARGRGIWVRAVGEVEFEESRPVRLVGAVQDITARKKLEQQVAEQERFLRQVTDSLPLRIAYIDDERRYRFVNQLHCQRFGRSRDEIIGRTRAELNPASVSEAAERALTAALAGHAQTVEYEETVDGAKRIVETQLIPDISPEGAVRGVFASGVDVTDRVAAARTMSELMAIFENTTDFVVQTDWRGRIRYMNPAVRHALGLEIDEPVAERTFAEFNTEQTNRRFADEILPALRQANVWVGDASVYLQGRREVPVSYLALAHRGADGRIDRYSSVMRDISREAQARLALARQSATLRAIAEAVPAIVAVVGEDRRYRYINSGFERWAGAHRDAVIGRTLPEVLGRAEFERSRPWIDRALSGERVEFEKQYSGQHAAKHLAISYIPLWNEGGQVDGFVGVALDITRHKTEEGRLLQLTHRDPLTGLLNRAGFDDYMDRSLLRCDPRELALLYIDLDHFKPVNDTYGHPVGDQLLRQLAQRLTRVVRPTDAVARLGGDEFAIALVGVREPAHAERVADKVIAEAQQPFEIGPLVLRIGASVGIAMGADPEGGWTALAERADRMLYQAKLAGRGRRAAEASSS